MNEPTMTGGCSAVVSFELAMLAKAASEAEIRLWAAMVARQSE